VPLSRDPETRAAARVSWAIAPGVLLAGVAGGIVFPILPIVGVQAGLPLPFIGVILAANRAMRVASSPVVGTLSDRFGGRHSLARGV
jgi:MFS family permease